MSSDRTNFQSERIRAAIGIGMASVLLGWLGWLGWSAARTWMLRWEVSMAV